MQAEHYDVVVATTGEEGFYRANAETFDLVLLDLMLPGRSGLEILRTLRQRQIETPVLVLTARDGVDDRVRDLDLGADDYLVKPFALPELLARIRALLRRGRPSETLRLKPATLELDLVAVGSSGAIVRSTSPDANSSCSNTCSGIRGISCRARCLPGTSGRSRGGPPRSTMSLTSRWRGCVARSTQTDCRG